MQFIFAKVGGSIDIVFAIRLIRQQMDARTRYLTSYRFDPPGYWRWPCRFSLEELKQIYSKLFGYNWFDGHYLDVLSPMFNRYVVGHDSNYGAVRLKDGGHKRLESCYAEELDWFLFIGASFGVITAGFHLASFVPNPLFGKLTREEAMITLDMATLTGL